jgi:hypothetical protein
MLKFGNAETLKRWKGEIGEGEGKWMDGAGWVG